MERDVGGYGLPVAKDQRVDHDRSASRRAEVADAVAPDVPGTAGDKNVHGNFETDRRGLYCAKGTVG